MTVFSAAALLFLVFDPLGNIPVFTCVLSRIEPGRRRRIIIRELLFALAILVMFLFVGRHILSLLGISQSSLGIAGGIILLMIAIKMVFSGSEAIFENAPDEEPFLVPLAVPLIAGPSAIATVILLMAKDPARWHHWFLALLSAWFGSGVLLMFSDRLSVFLGTRGSKAVERLMGMILTAVAVEMLIKGIRASFFT
jgi:multiple antibiotic resistance protein